MNHRKVTILLQNGEKESAIKGKPKKRQPASGKLKKMGSDIRLKRLSQPPLRPKPYENLSRQRETSKDSLNLTGGVKKSTDHPRDRRDQRFKRGVFKFDQKKERKISFFH